MDNWRGPLLIGCAALVWGTTSVAAKALFDISSLQPLGLVFLRLTIACPCFLALSLWFGEFRLLRHRAGTIRSLALLGVMQAAFQMSYFEGVRLIGAGVATLIALCLAPALVAVVAVPLLKERLFMMTGVSLAGALVGTACLALEHGVDVGGQWLAGLAISFMAALSYAAFTLASRHVASTFAAYETAFVCFLAGALTVLPFTLATRSLEGLGTLDLWSLLLLLYVSLVPTCLGYACFFWGVRSTSATLAGILVTLEPFFAALFAWFLLGETMTSIGVLGAVVLMVAVMGAVLSRR